MTAVIEKPDIRKPADLAEHQADLELRKEEREAKRETLRKCIDPKYAAKLEQLKPEYEYKVWCKYPKQTPKGVTWTEIEKEVIGQNDNDAWAKFCDEIGAWPSPSASERKITKGKKVA